MKIVFSIFLCCITLLSFNAQDTLKLLYKWKVEAIDFEVDNFGYIYTYNSLKIEKHKADGTLVATYSNYNLGDISSIDVNNPLRILALHKNQNTLVILDNTLSLEQDNGLDLTALGLYNTTAFTYSSLNNGIWFYDKELFQLIKTNQLMETIYQSGNLLQLLNKETLGVKQLIEDDDKLYLVCEKYILVFDLYGAYYNTLHFPYYKGIEIKNNIIFTFNKGHLKAYDTKTFEEQISNFVLDDKLLHKLNEGFIYELGEKSFSIYAIESSQKK